MEFFSQNVNIVLVLQKSFQPFERVISILKRKDLISPEKIESLYNNDRMVMRLAVLMEGL